MLNLSSLNQRVNALTGKINSLVPPAGGTLSAVLTAGNSAGSNDIDMNSNDITNVSLINGSAYPPAPPATPALSAVLTAGDNAGGLSIQNLNNLGVTTINGSAYPPAVDTLQQVLTAGNTASGANAKITLTDTDAKLTIVNSSVGGVANPLLVLQNNNTTAGGTTFETYKNDTPTSTGGDVVGIWTATCNTDVGKTEITRISAIANGVGASNNDGSVAIACKVNSALTNFIICNGGSAPAGEIQAFKNINVVGNSVRTSQGSITLDATSSTTTGDILLTPKTTGYVRVSEDILTDSKITTQQGFPSNVGSFVDLANGNPDDYFRLDKNNLTFREFSTFPIDKTNQIDITNNVVSGANYIYQTQTDNLTGTGVSNQNNCNLTTQNIYLIDNRAGYNQSIDINNGYTNSENRISMFKNSGGGIYNQAVISNQVNTQGYYLSNTNNAVSKDIALSNGAGGSLVYTNSEDNNGFSVASSLTNLTLQTTGTISGQGDIVIAPSQNGTANGQIVFTGASLQSNTASGNSGEHLIIVLNGNTYKIKLENP